MCGFVDPKIAVLSLYVHNATEFCMLIITNKIQPNTKFFIAVKALHVSGGFPAHYQELKNSTHRIWYLLSLVAAAASVVEMELRTLAMLESCLQTCMTYTIAECTENELLMMYRRTVRNT
jgi:hypothetical protein